MTSYQISLNDIQNLLSPISTSSTTSFSDAGFGSNAITELIRKRRNRLETEKKAKDGSKISEILSSESESYSPPKMIKLDEQKSTTTKTNESLSNDTSESSIVLSDDSSPLSFYSNASSSSPWSQLSFDTSSLSSPSTLNSPTSNFLPNISKKNIVDEFSTVCGRLSLLNSQKYVITVGEMARRIFGKEEFSFSLLGGILRRAKTPNSTNALKAELQSIGIDIERGRRRNCRLTLFSGLLEGEAVQLGKDFCSLLSSTFPSPIIAQYLAEEAAEKLEKDKLKKVEQLKVARNFVNEFLNILNQDSSPIQDLYSIPTLPDSIQNHLTDFSLLTHGFGMFAVKSVVEMYGQILDTQILSLS